MRSGTVSQVWVIDHMGAKRFEQFRARERETGRERESWASYSDAKCVTTALEKVEQVLSFQLHGNWSDYLYCARFKHRQCSTSFAQIPTSCSSRVSLCRQYTVH